MASTSNPPLYDVADSVTEPPEYNLTAVRPKPAGTPLTTHVYTLNPNPHTDVSLTLNTSHAPSPTNLPLYFFPGTVAGEVTLNLKKTAAIKSVVVVVEAVKMSSSAFGKEPVAGEPPRKPIWSAASPNLLRTFADGTIPGAELETKNEKPSAVDLGAGPHTFAFSLEIPTTYKKSEVTGTVIPWLKSLVGVGKEKAEAYVETPLPPTTLAHRGPVLRPTQYRVTLSVETGVGNDDYQFYKEVVVLPLEEEVPEKSGDVKVADP